ncbi:HET-domain-containing protein [Phaeosphaeriaceae sp. SRC1lsM3a]|nr:HET-domain-containing protein [Stagonospora sp. SRC1lsM3a]
MEEFSPSPAAVVFYNRNWTELAVFEIIPSRDNRLDPVSRLLDLNSIDFDRIRLWLQSCSKADLALQPHEKTDYLPGFRLIHCRSRKITEPSQKYLYVALSYVWGRELPEESQSRRFPQTIEDAIRVCLKLGFEYLWIDRYCIDQENYEDKHAQISRMDVIYSEASLVIIAAAGEDPTYGLPGAGSQSRTPQQSIKLRDCTLLQTFPRVEHELEASTWTSREWTLQEGHFGTRKLIFPDCQVTYICKHGICNESVSPRMTWDSSPRDWRLADEHECGRQRSLWRLDAYFSFEDSHPQKRITESEFRKWRIIEEFTKRKLSYDSDVYNTIRGIFSS